MGETGTPRPPRQGTKQEQVLALLRRPEGAIVVAGAWAWQHPPPVPSCETRRTQLRAIECRRDSRAECAYQADDGAVLRREQELCRPSLAFESSDERHSQQMTS